MPAVTDQALPRVAVAPSTATITARPQPNHLALDRLKARVSLTIA
jgi:hypothetical protein